MANEIEHWSLKQTVAPQAEPVSVAEAKAHLRVEITDDDDVIARLCAGARRRVERTIGRQLVTATWVLVKDFFAPIDLLLPRIFGDLIRLPRPPLIEVLSVQYVDTAGVPQTLATTEYQVDALDEPGRLRPAFGKYWPATRWQLGAVTITYNAGYATPFIVSNLGGSTFAAQGRTPLAGERWRLTNSGGKLPAGLATFTDYYVINPGEGATFQLSLTAGGAAVTVTDVGSGTSFLGEVPEGIKDRVKQVLGYAYTNRELCPDAEGMPAVIDTWLMSEWTGEL
jgi:uncharacterized phiE125 gp8 family phage protein